MSKPKVFLTGGDNLNWALDDDLRLTKRAIESFVEFTNLDECDIIHSMWWGKLVEISEKSLIGKRIICHIPGEPFRYFSIPQYSKAAEKVSQWIVRSREAEEELASVDVHSKLIPYTVDPDIFHNLQANDIDLITFRKFWSIPSDRYLIGNFHRDTEGHDLKSPKLMKGPDIFVEIVRSLREKGYNIHILLAGPRRFWMRKRLEELDIPYTFIGEIVEGIDDNSVNILSRKILNYLYNLIDLYIISSRTEGGPQSIMEAAFSQCKVISTKVGLAVDILEQDCIYASPIDAVGIIEKDICSNFLQLTIKPHYQHVKQNHQPNAVTSHFRDLYAHVEQIPPFHRRVILPITHKSTSIHVYIIDRLNRMLGDKVTIGIWHKFFKPPFGGGNQFMIALKKAMKKKGIRIIENRNKTSIDAYILNSIHFDVKSFRKYNKKNEIKIIHRIDGPIHLIRGFDRQLDDLCFEVNTEFASATVLQSAWTYQRIIEMGYQPVNPVIIHNAVDPDIFHSHGRIPFDPERKIRLISTSWSNNPRKGGPIYKWIERHLDWKRFEYTFIGNASEHFDHIHQIPPVPSDQLANILRQHDIFITASQNDPCSNALIEALSCGLPALYLNDGGHPELVGYGGLPFNNVDEIFTQLEDVVENYNMFQNLIVVPSLDDVVDKYLNLVLEVDDIP